MVEERDPADLEPDGVQFGFLFGGTLLIEVIFSYPGLAT